MPVAVAPVTATVGLVLCKHVGFVPAGQTEAGGRPASLVDPILTDPVRPGRRFWRFLYPTP